MVRQPPSLPFGRPHGTARSAAWMTPSGPDPHAALRMSSSSGWPTTRPERRSDSVLPITDRLQQRSAWRAKGPNIPYRWLAEETAVFAAELAGALVADLKGRTRSGGHK